MDSQALPESENAKGQMQLASLLLIDTVAEISICKKKALVIKSLQEAFTLSRFEKDGKIHTMAVLEDDGESVKGVDLSVTLSRYDSNSFDVIKDMEFNEIVKIILECTTTVTVKYKKLLPCVTGEEHLAIGINYAEHGKETGQVRPFMFPKFVATDPAVHYLHYEKGWLLDYEVELGIAFPSAVCLSSDVEHLRIGFLVVNDFTDRATLMRKMDSQNVTGGKGFPDAKSKIGFLPTGPYMVIPRDWRAFVKELQLQLCVNGELRQRGNAKDMVWKIDEIIERSLAVKGKKCSYYQDKTVTLFTGDCIPSNSIIITGTPAGTAFNAPKRSFIFGTLIKYICTGRFLSAKMHPYILQQYLKKQMKNPFYLKPGDQVESCINYLGTIKTRVQ
ncbi:fumarylacetoacetate hydrolase family protein [Flavobacterium chryseum]|uniref:fumarylacetoacetate hydrolase family protein n=1 Tax=Flavobacterium sp. P3160 TaxID=2512113 RepID=UPI00141501C3|nr:fumarylacetoacetate hydrolase family protein [Flavobacterium sp. P3160]